MHLLLPICGKFTRALIAHQFFLTFCQEDLKKIRKTLKQISKNPNLIKFDVTTSKMQNFNSIASSQTDLAEFLIFFLNFSIIFSKNPNMSMQF
jgi:hypothetical protein